MSESFDNDVYERALASGESEKSARARATSYNSDKRSKVQYFRRVPFGKNGGVIEEEVSLVECCPCCRRHAIKIIIDGKTVYDSEDP